MNAILLKQQLHLAKLFSVTHLQDLNIPLPFRLYTILYIPNLRLHLHPFPFTFSIPITPSDTENYLPSDDPNIINLMVSHYDCAKQHILRQINLLNVKQCTEALPDNQHVSVNARVYVRAKTKRIKAFKGVAYAKEERKICFQGSVKYRPVDRTVWNHNTLPLPVTLDPLECKNIIRHLNGTNNKILNNLKYRRVDRTVWNHNSLPLPVTLDPLECKNIIRHLNGTNNKILNNIHYNKSFTLLEDHYFQERLERYQTPFTVYQLNKMYTGTFTFMPADQNWVYVPTQNPYHNCPAHHQFEVNLVSWRYWIELILLYTLHIQ